MHGTVMERRRLRAAQLFKKGWRITDIARVLDVSAPAVSQWIAILRTKGEDGLISRPRTGAPRRLSARHSLMLQVLLKQRPRVHELDADEWNRMLVQRVIKKLFGITYSVQHCGRLLKTAKSSKQAIPRLTRLELDDLLKKTDIARIRTRLGKRHVRSSY